jgi:hypothetical protein
MLPLTQNNITHQDVGKIALEMFPWQSQNIILQTYSLFMGAYIALLICFVLPKCIKDSNTLP